MGLGFGHVQLRKLQSFRWLDDVPLLGATIQRATITTVFCASPRHPFAAFVRSSIQKKKKKREALLLGFFYNLWSFRVQRSTFLLQLDHYETSIQLLWQE